MGDLDQDLVCCCWSQVAAGVGSAGKSLKCQSQIGGAEVRLAAKTDPSPSS